MAKKHVSKESLYNDLKFAEDQYRSAFKEPDGNIAAAYRSLCYARDKYYNFKEPGTVAELKEKIAAAEAKYRESFSESSCAKIMDCFNELQRLKKSYFGLSELAKHKSLMDQQCAGIIDDTDDDFNYSSDSLI